MRVIAGSAKKMRLFTPSGMEVRPTTDRIKETLFNILQNDIPGCTFLDLFSGSGAMGVEALSRNADKAVFIEKDPVAVACIRKNLEHTKLAERATVLSMDVIRGLKELETRKMQFDVVFMDPPYNKDLERKALEYLQNSTIISEKTLLVIETAVNTSIDYLKDFHYHIKRVKTYKTNQHLFLMRT